MKRQLVELEREIGLTTPLIAELDGRLTGQSVAAEKPQSPTSPSAKASSSTQPTVKTVEVESISGATVEEKMATAVDNRLQMESTAGSDRTFQVCWKLATILLKAHTLLRSVTLSDSPVLVFSF